MAIGPSLPQTFARVSRAVAWVLLWAALAALAQAPVQSPPRRVVDAGGPAWQSLTPPQRSALAPLQGEWHSIDAARKAKWIEIANRYPRLPAEEQQRLQARMTQWSQLSPAERGQARLNFQEVKQLPREQRQAQWEAYQALPEDERQALARRARPAAPGGQLPPRAPTVPEEQPKRKFVATPSVAAAPARPVAPTVVQAAPGATTTLVTRQPAPPPHQQTGLPKVAASPGFVDRATLLPKRGPQGAATRSAVASQPKSP